MYMNIDVRTCEDVTRNGEGETDCVSVLACCSVTAQSTYANYIKCVKLADNISVYGNEMGREGSHSFSYFFSSFFTPPLLFIFFFVFYLAFLPKLYFSSFGLLK